MRYIIRNESSSEDTEAMEMVKSVIEKGLISGDSNNKQHCYATLFHDRMVYCSRNKSGSETFCIIDYMSKQQGNWKTFTIQGSNLTNK